MGFGKLLKEKMQLKNVKQSELSAALGIPKTTLSSMINRDNMKVDIEMFLKICDYLECDPEEFYQEHLKNKKQNAERDSFTADEIEYIRKCRYIDENGINVIKQTIDYEYERCKKINSLKNKFMEQQLDELPEKYKENIISLICIMQDYIDKSIKGYNNVPKSVDDLLSQFINLINNEDGFNTLISLIKKPSLNLNEKDDEEEIISKYMSLSPEIRACMLDVLVQLGEAAKKRQTKPDPDDTDYITVSTTLGELEDQMKADEDAKSKDA